MFLLGKKSFFYNEKKTFMYETLEVTEGKEHLLSIIRAFDSLMLRYGASEYFDDGRPHVSLLKFPALDSLPPSEPLKSPIEVIIHSIQVTIGTWEYVIPFSSSDKPEIQRISI